MTTKKVDFTAVRWWSVEWTMLCTLYLRAYESRSEHSILADNFAAAAVDRIDYDFDKIKKTVRPSSNQFIVALRARQFDLWAGDFLDRHPEAVVLHLGCGLDSRAFRLDPPAGVHWFDLDVPAVIELRRQVYSEHEHYHMIGSSVTVSDWLDMVPTDRPVLIIAEGLLMYLTENEVRQLLQRLTDRFSTGELLFDAGYRPTRWRGDHLPLPPWFVESMKIHRWGTRDGRELGQWNPRLKYLAQTSTMSHFSKIPVSSYRILYRLLNAIPAARRFNQQFRFEF